LKRKLGFSLVFKSVVRYFSFWGAHRDAHLAKMSGDKTGTWV